MDDALRKEFLDLFLDDGAMTKLNKATDQVRTTLFTQGLSVDQKWRLGHCGVGSEYLHGIGSAQQYITFFKKTDDDLKQALDKLVKCFTKPSHLSKAPQEIAGKLINNETAFDAIPRAISDAREWAETAELSPDESDTLETALTEASQQYQIVRDFAEKYRHRAPR